MKRILIPLTIMAALAAAGPASAQLVNGIDGGNGPNVAPIGAKAGGGSSSIDAPGERGAVRGAIHNEREFKAEQSLPETRVISRADTDRYNDNRGPYPYTGHDMEGQ